jgi:hypothetical protein
LLELTETSKRGLNVRRDQVNGVVAINLLEAALIAVMLDDGSGLGFEGLHTLGKDGLGVIGALGES